jgi:hypothetical protein
MSVIGKNFIVNTYFKDLMASHAEIIDISHKEIGIEPVDDEEQQYYDDETILIASCNVTGRVFETNYSHLVYHTDKLTPEKIQDLLKKQNNIIRKYCREFDRSIKLKNNHEKRIEHWMEIGFSKEVAIKKAEEELNNKNGK